MKIDIVLYFLDYKSHFFCCKLYSKATYIKQSRSSARVWQNSSTAMWKTHCQFSQTLDCSCCCKGWHDQLLELLFHVGPGRFGQLFSLNKWNHLLRLYLCRANASTTVKRVHVYIEKTMEKHRNWIKTPVKNYYCMSNISCLHHGDRLKAAVQFSQNIYC